MLSVRSVQLQDFVTELGKRQLGVPRFQQLRKLSKLVRIQLCLQLETRIRNYVKTRGRGFNGWREKTRETLNNVVLSTNRVAWMVFYKQISDNPDVTLCFRSRS